MSIVSDLNPLNWKIIGIAAAIIVVICAAGGFWIHHLSSSIDSLNQEVGAQKIQLAQAQTDSKTLKTSIGEVATKLAALDSANTALRDKIETDRQTVGALRLQLTSLTKLAASNPEQFSSSAALQYQHRLQCLEIASGRKPTADELKDSALALDCSLIPATKAAP